MLVAAAALSCGDPTTPRSAPGINFIAGNEVTDTAGAILKDLLIVEARDASGKPAGGTLVRLESVFIDSITVEAMIAITPPAYTSVDERTADAAGRVAVRVRLGFRAGRARIRVSIPALGFVDTAAFTVEPASASAIAVTPSDTLVYPGRTFAATGTVRDAYGNPRTDAVVWGVNGTGVTVTNAGVVSAVGVGRYTITASLMAGVPLQGSGTVSVVPRMRLVAFNFVERTIVARDIDGSDQRVVARVGENDTGALPEWITGTTNVIFPAVDDGFLRLQVVTTAGDVSRWMATLPAGMSSQAEAAPTADGNWIFFSANNTACGTGDNFCIHRATPSGTSPTLLAIDFPSRQPSPSPDGSKVAFVRDFSSDQIRVFDIAMGTVSSWSVAGTRPSWSPTGGKIAFIANGEVATVNPDGGGLAPLTASGDFGWLGPIAWSPDGNWILARHVDRLKLVELATGTVIPISGTNRLFGGSLRN